MPETTKLNPLQEELFKRWALENAVSDVDAPESHYDYRGFWQQNKGPHKQDEHYPDTFKQHGHPTFSVESKYSTGPGDGGRWIGEKFVPPGADFLVNSRGQSRLPAEELLNTLFRSGK
jgi:hypothetical protein